MAIIEEDVVKKWDDMHKGSPEMQTVDFRPIIGKTYKNISPNGKIRQGGFGYSKYFGKSAVVAFNKDFDCKVWEKQVGYVFDFVFLKEKPDELSSVKISFERRTDYDHKSSEFYKFLYENFNGEKINSNELLVSRGRINKNHLVIKMELDPKTTAEKICETMKDFVDETQKKISEYLDSSSQDEDVLSTPMTEYQEKLFSEVLQKHNIDENSPNYSGCKSIYCYTMKILSELSVFGNNSIEEEEEKKEEASRIEVSHYTSKSTADKMFLDSKFRLWHILGMNDPSEGKVLMSIFEVRHEKEVRLHEYLPFIACFSLNVNSLNQFRLYGKESKEEAKGVSIIFDSLFFCDKIHNNEDKIYPLYRCVYANPEAGNIDEAIMSISSSSAIEGAGEERLGKVKMLFKGLEKSIENSKNINAELIRDLLINIRYIVKHYAFAEEQECRIVDIRKKDDLTIDSKKEDDSALINYDNDRLYLEDIMLNKDNILEIYFAPLAEGMEVFEVKTGIDCIRSNHPYKSK